MKKHLSTILLVLVFIVGLSVLLYPTIADYVNSKSQSRAIAQYIETMSHLDPDKYAEELAEAQAYNASLLSNNTRFSPSEEEAEAYHHYLGADNSAIGYLEIPVIKVSLPMYLGAEASVLQVGIGCMPGSSLPVGGPGTHAVLTGHRGLPSSRLLTDLDQVAVGDIFTMVVLNEVMTYQVDQIRIVLPHEMEALEIVEGEDYCTLVTCTPYGINTHRLLVRGHQVDASQKRNIYIANEAYRVDPLIVMPIVALPIIFVLLIYVMVVPPKKETLGEDLE